MQQQKQHAQAQNVLLLLDQEYPFQAYRRIRQLQRCNQSYLGHFSLH